MAKLAPGLKPRLKGDGETKPHLLLAAAVAYARAAKLALDDSPAQMIMPAYMLAGFSVEFSLKAYILQKTGDAALLFALGHNLRSAWSKATALGLDVNGMHLRADDFGWLIEAFSDHHERMTFRYLPDVKPFKVTITPADLVIGAGAFAAVVARDVSIPEDIAETTA